MKEPKSNKKTIIVFSCYFKHESKQFKYSTGEKINPNHWSFSTNKPNLKGKYRDLNSNSISTQLNRYSNKFEEIYGLCLKINEDFTSKTLREAFDVEFKKVNKDKNLFFDVYKEFMDEKKKRHEWKPSTVKRYNNIKNHLKEFEKDKKYKLTFNKINSKFYTEFVNYCYTTLDHNTNTFSRNIGLFKTFMFWSLKEKYTYNDSFKDFKKPERVITKEVALTIDQVKSIFEFELTSKALERVRDVFVFQCLTGLRYGELKLISKRSVVNNILVFSEEKDVTKEAREVPLFEISNFILKKYGYELPLLTNQKYNDAIKDVFEEAEFTYEVEYTRTKNKEREIKHMPFNKRISTHTARRSFVTIMKKKGIADKTIMNMTGHRDLKTFNTYYKVDNIAKVDAVNLAFGSMELPKLKKA
ncbi:tyrosine-type recombinase/integrase [Algibacter lectus]|uniref:tyrosine-type recombinase/integrase n=1 Tax=Algibacter lectus TaxID=221126 RepID=UPI0026F0684D|nr:tyrosine-type recombinase/integrase [Algibacter lectus]MDO7138276.1 phage integrase SAM-like domain-containing protein [Algibacter lectus]